jgi:hypothetical protein
MTDDARLYGLPEAAAAMFQPVLKDMDKFPRLKINLACAHMNVSNFSSAGALLCEVMRSPDNALKMDAALTLLDMTINRKSPTQADHFQQAAQVIDDACVRGSPKAWQVREQLSRVNFNIRLEPQ